MTKNPSYLPFSDTLYSSLCRIAEVALQSNRSDSFILPAELVHECFLKLAKSSTNAPTDPIEFRALAATMIRQALVDRVRKKNSLKRGDGHGRVALDDETDPSTEVLHFDVLVLDESLEELAALDSRQARIVELRFFGGLSIIEIAHALGIAPRTVNTDWTLARAWLRRALS